MEPSKQQVKDIEIKQKLSAGEFKQTVQKLLQGLESQQDIPVTLAGKEYHFPAQILKTGKYEVEFEIDEGEYELQLQIKGTL